MSSILSEFTLPCNQRPFAARITGPKGAVPIIGLDFGTATVAVAVVVKSQGEISKNIDFHSIIPIHGWSNDPRGGRSLSVPTLIYFPPDAPFTKPVCGYDIETLLRIPDPFILSNPHRYFDNLKMMLYEGREKEGTSMKYSINKKFEQLHEEGYTDPPHTLISRLIIWILNFVKDSIFQRVDPEAKPEFAISMPANWGIRADRIMCTCCDMAVREVWSLYKVNEAASMFTVAEPDSQSTFLLGFRGGWYSRDVKVHMGENILVADAGGGTFEANCYNVTNEKPFRFQELCRKTADTCGSAFLNEAFCALVHKKIMNIEFGFPPETTVEKAPGTMISLVQYFENLVKRNMNLNLLNSNNARDLFNFRSRILPNRFFSDHSFTINDEEWYNLFTPLTVRALEVLRDQYNQSKDCQKPFKIDLIIVSGEYSLNAELRRAITNYVSTWADLPRIEFTNERTSAAVPIGSVYRALDKSNGPGRFLRAGFGLVRHLPAPIDPEDDPNEFDFPANNPEFSKFSPANNIKISKGRDGHWHSFGTVEWILPNGTALAPGQIFGPYGSRHMFETIEEPWVFSESLFTTAADDMENGWPWDHDKNRSAERYGDVAIDMNAVKKYAAQLHVLNHYEVDLDLYFTVGAEFHHQLTFEARCGSGDLPAGMIEAKVNVMLQPFFQPSTK